MMEGCTLLALNPNFPCLSWGVIFTHSLPHQLLMWAHRGLILDLIAALQLIILKGEEEGKGRRGRFWEKRRGGGGAFSFLGVVKTAAG